MYGKISRLVAGMNLACRTPVSRPLATGPPDAVLFDAVLFDAGPRATRPRVPALPGFALPGLALPGLAVADPSS